MGKNLSFTGSSLSADHLISPWWIGMLCPWQEELVPEFMLFQKISWRWSQRWSWPCLPAWWAEEWSEYKRDDRHKEKNPKCNKNPTCHPGCMSSRSAVTMLKCCWPWNWWSSKDFVLLCKTNLSKFSGGGVLTNRHALFPKESVTYQELTEMHS